MKLETTLWDSNPQNRATEMKPLLLESLWLTNQIRVISNSGIYREVSNPVIGRDFVSGLLEDERNVGFFRKSCLREIEFGIPTNSSYPLIFTRKTLAEQLQLQQFPALANYSYRDSSSVFSAMLLGAARGFLVRDFVGQPVIPIASLAQIEIRNG